MARHVGCYQIGDWQFDVDTMVLCLDSQYQIEVGSAYHHDRKAHSLKLPFKTADLLALLAEYSGEIVTLEVMGDRIWGGRHDIAKRGIVNTISKLRGILTYGEFAQYIVNEPLKGYRLCVPVKIIDHICQPTPTPADPNFAQILGWTPKRKRKRKRHKHEQSAHLTKKLGEAAKIERNTTQQQQKPQFKQKLPFLFLHFDLTRYRWIIAPLYRWRRAIALSLIAAISLLIQACSV